MNLSWKQVLLCTTVSAMAGYIGYRVYTTYSSGSAVKAGKKKEEEEEKKRQEHSNADGMKEQKSTTNTASNSVKKPRAKKDKKPTATQSSADNPGALPAELMASIEQCELPVSEILKLDTETKQRIFYTLLTRGEYKMHQSNYEQAVSDFSKAVTIVPNPGEVVAALEKMLPPPMFNALLDKIQKELVVKVGEYFEGITPEGGRVRFREVEESIEGVEGAKGKNWYPYAMKDVQVGEVLWEETADIVSPLVSNLEGRCEFCMRNLNQVERVACNACQEQLYCSKQCREKSALVYHPFFCKPDAVVSEAMEELKQFGAENGSSMGLLMMRYIAMLLGEELRGNGTANNGPFAHYDHLKPTFNAPTDVDRKEAKILRRIFSASNEQVVQCKIGLNVY